MMGEQDRGPPPSGDNTTSPKAAGRGSPDGSEPRPQNPRATGPVRRRRGLAHAPPPRAARIQGGAETPPRHTATAVAAPHPRTNGVGQRP